MLLFIDVGLVANFQIFVISNLQVQFFYFKTSHVIVYPRLSSLTSSTFNYFKTSHVIVYRHDHKLLH